MHHQDDSIEVDQAKSLLEESYQNFCSRIAAFNVKQLEKRKAHFIDTLQASGLESALDPMFIERARKNSLSMFPLKNVDAEIPPCLVSSESSANAQRVTIRHRSRSNSPNKSLQSSSSPQKIASPDRPSWSGTMSLSSSRATKNVPMEDVKVNLVLSGHDRTSVFSQRLSDADSLHSIHFEASFATIKRSVSMSVIRESAVETLVAWASKHLDTMSCKNFGITYTKLKTRAYWIAAAKKGTHFMVSLDDEVVGYVPLFNINSLDNTGVPAYFGATQRKTIAVRNLACLGYIKGLPREGYNDSGVMQFAVRYIMNWILEAEPRLSGCLVVIKVPNSDSDSSKPEVIRYIERSKHLAESLNMKKQPEFHGSRMGNNNAYLLLREDIE